LSRPRLASGFWVAAKLRQIQNGGGYASILVKGHEEAGAINLILRLRDGTLKRAVPAIGSDNANGEREFVWLEQALGDEALTALIARELRFDRDQWFLECECTQDQFEEIFSVKLV
jgi:hypothetical protein